MSDKPKRSYTRPPGSRGNAGAAANSGADRPSQWRRMPRVVMLVLWAATLAGAGYGLNRADATAARGVQAETRIEWVNKPAWLDGEEWREELTELERIHGLYRDTDVLDPRVTAYVGERLR